MVKTDCSDVRNCGVGGKIMREVTDTFISGGGRVWREERALFYDDFKVDPLDLSYNTAMKVKTLQW